MFIQNDITLSAYSTMRLGGIAKHIVEVSNRYEIPEAVAWAKERQLPVIMIGGGSNIIWRDEGFQGLVIINRIPGYETFVEDDENIYLTVGAGEDWDSVVARSVEAGYSGIEQLSLIPGSSGATPIQNVGAYGQEISNVLVCLQAYDALNDELVTIYSSDCGFGYRTSRFKTTDRGQFFIVNITMHLTKSLPKPPFYTSVQSYFDANHITDITVQAVRDAVINIRNGKLPDPRFIANNGSFFANPIVPETDLVQLLADYPDIAYWRQPNGTVKIAGAWLIEHAGFKGAFDPETGMSVWDKQALVLVNQSASSTADLLKFKHKIVSAVQEKFGITLTQEPELLPQL